MAINVGTYNRERIRLAEAGSKRVALAHVAHGRDSVPDDYGQTLVDEAQMDEEELQNLGKIKEADRLRAAIRLAKNAFGLYSKK